MLIKEKVKQVYERGVLEEGWFFDLSGHPYQILKVRDPGRWGPDYVDAWIQREGGTPQWITIKRNPSMSREAERCCLTG